MAYQVMETPGETVDRRRAGGEGELWAICLCPRYAVSGTETAYGTVCLRASYAMSGTYTARSLSSYAFPMPCPVLRYGMLLVGEWEAIALEDR
eukprot:3523312-Rhodomonas_salina.3